MTQGSNSKAMTVEERLVDKFKNEGLAMLVGDEDAIAELARRAIEKALFQETPIPGSAWNDNKKRPSPAVEAAHEVAKLAAQKLVDQQVGDLINNPEFAKTVREAVAASMLVAVQNAAFTGVQSVVDRDKMDTMQRLRAVVFENGLKPAHAV